MSFRVVIAWTLLLITVPVLGAEVVAPEPIVLQRAVPVQEDDTVDSLAARVFEEEKVAYADAIQLFASGRLSITGRRVRITPAG